MPIKKTHFPHFTVLVALLAGTPLCAAPGDAVGMTNNNCTACHGSIRTDRMQVTPQSLQIDLGTQLDGSTPGELNTFQVEPGSTVLLTMDVLNGSGPWAAQLKQLEKGGQELDLSNSLQWSQSGNTGWRSWGSGIPYMATTIQEDTGAQTLTLSLTIDAATPPDTYNLVFAMAGKSSGLYYQEEHFYLEVLGATASTWAGYTLDPEGNTDTGSFMNWINVSDIHDYVWVYDLGKYLYLPEGMVTESGAWVYIQR